MAQSITVLGGTATSIAVTGSLALNPVAKSTTVMLSATALSTTAGTVQIEMSLDDPTQLGGPAATWALLSSATAITSSLVAATPLVYTVLSPIGQVRVNSTTGSTGAGVTYVLKALQSVTA